MLLHIILIRAQPEKLEIKQGITLNNCGECAIKRTIL
jgi:hypothetical protein